MWLHVRSGKYCNFAGLLRESKSNRCFYIFIYPKRIRVPRGAARYQELYKKKCTMSNSVFHIRLWIIGLLESIQILRVF